MKKLVIGMISLVFLFYLLTPINSIAGEEIHLAAAIGASKKPTDSSGGTSGSETPPSTSATTTAAAGAGKVSVGMMVAIGAGVAGLVVAAGKSESASNH